MFSDRSESLCAEKGVKPNRACQEMGVSRSLAAKWKATGTEKPSADVLEKMSAYFGKTIDEILGKSPATSVTFDEFTYAMYNEAKDLPEEIMLTSFSILFARYKGNLEAVVKGAYVLDDLKDRDKVLISEGCTHHRQCGDIGSVKLPAWIRKFSGAEPEFVFTSGGEFPKRLYSELYSTDVSFILYDCTKAE